MITSKVLYSAEPTKEEIQNSLLSREIATEAIVLLENNGVLPLKKQRVALFGAGAQMTIPGGSGSGEVIARDEVSVYQGLVSAGFEIGTKKWLSDYQKEWEMGKEAFLEETRKSIKSFNLKTLSDMMSKEYRYPFGRRITEEDIRQSHTDTCIYVIARQSGEGKDRSIPEYDYSISPVEQKNIELCAAAYKNFIVVLNVGAAFDANFFNQIEGIDALIYMSQLGMNGGAALADVLTGKVSPSGKLSETWAMRYSDIPFSDEFALTEENKVYYKEGIFVGYRYFDSFGVEPAYPFGYGLSYTTFTTSCTGIVHDKKRIVLTVEVTNTGSVYAGKEVIQVYVTAPASRLSKEYQKLVAFEKTRTLAPGETQSLDLIFDLETLGVYCEDAATYMLEKGEYYVRVGNSSRNTEVAALLAIEKDIVLSKHSNCCVSEEKITKIERPHWETPVLKKNTVVIRIAEVDGFPIAPEEYRESIPRDIEEFIKERSEDELIELVTGVGLLGGNNYFNVPGSVGKTTSKLVKYNISNVHLADGPAGLRLTRRSTIDKKGKTKMVDVSISILEFLPKFIKKLMVGNPKKETMVYQFVTGFPVSHAVAQTWNRKLAYRMGEAVSAEMTKYGVTYWLAPAINIIRNPLCGRNYEYFSEDPVLTGLMAAAMCKGVQETEGNYVTVKHFACNNQETNRTTAHSMMDERVLREIYLKAFEIIVKEARPAAIMGAYNGINGTFCNNNGELCNQILRKEWHYDGIVMTDWFATGSDKSRANHWQTFINGVDLIMPGGDSDKKCLKEALKKGKLNRAEMELSASRILKQIAQSKVQKELFPGIFEDV